MKRIISLLLAFSLLFGNLPMLSGAEMLEDDLESAEITETVAATQFNAATNSKFSTFEELKRICAQTYSSFSEFHFTRTGSLVISEDLTIPENCQIYFSSVQDDYTVTVAAGCALTVDGGMLVKVPLNVSGTLINNGWIEIFPENGFYSGKLCLAAGTGASYQGTGQLVIYSDSLIDLADVIQGVDLSTFTVTENEDTKSAYCWELWGTSAAPEAAPDAGTPVKTGSLNGNYYEVYDVSMTWSEAVDYCKQLGGHLVTITSAVEQAYLADLIKAGEKNQYWLGARRTEEDAFDWVTDEEFSYSNWDWIEPNRHSYEEMYEDYVQMYNKPNPYGIGSEQGKWNDIYIDNVFPGEEDYFNQNAVGFICEYESDSRGDSADGTLPAIRISDGTFSYYSTVEGKTVNYTFDYDEEWFFKNSTSYNHDLSRMTMRMALAAARTGTSSITDLFQTLGYGDVVTDYPDPPTKDSIGYAIGSKKVRNEDGETATLIAVAVRGGGYKTEWASNFKVGTASIHQGFLDAANTVLDAVKDYISKLDADGNIKLWITGYSRAGAATNIVAHQLNADARNDQIKGLEENDIFAYCFECPRTVWNTHPSFSAADSNIFNIVNPIDFVPMVAMEDWKFDRFGITYYLPCNEINYSSFSSGYEEMQYQYGEILDAAGSDADVSELTGYAKKQHTNLTKMVNAVASYFGSQSTYAVGYQSDITEAIAKQNGFDVVSVLKIFFGNLAAFPILHPVLTSATVANYKNIGYAHYPELCMAWLDALQGYDLVKSPKTRYLIANCPVNLAVYDSYDELVAEIVGDEIREYSTIGACIDENGQKIVILPFDEEFRVEITATDDGTMSCQIQEYDFAAGAATRVLNYYDVEIRSGDVLSGTLGTGDGTAAYALHDAEGREIPVDNELSGDAVGSWNVTVSAEGSGTVTGGGNFATGEFAKVTAAAGSGTTFLGWYAGNTLVSTETEYRFRVEKDTIITGKFEATAAATLWGDVNGDGVADSYDAALILKYDVMLIGDSDLNLAAADVSGDGFVDSYDASLILKFDVMLIDKFPAEE